MRSISSRWAVRAAVVLAVVTVSCVLRVSGASEALFPRRQKVPPFPPGITWLNTAGPLTLEDLRGKFVLVDFWTYCCINCMHILPELKRLEEAYPKNLVVIGIHSAKFATERDSQNIREAIGRYRIAHPVINDANHVLWDRFGVTAWPSLFLIDPEGYVIWSTSGEITFAQLDRVLKTALPHYRQNRLLDETPLRFDVLRDNAAPTPLSFPGKILADRPGDRLFVADSNHNRIVVARLDGSLLETIGSGAAGRADGEFATAEFNQPQGMALHEADLFVADTENHLIRKVDLIARRVTTVAGLGRQGESPALLRSAPPRKAALSSPWDLWTDGEDLWIAMAGWHQIWRLRLDGSAIGPYAGNGREDIVDGRLLPRQRYEQGFASFAQPSGLSGDGTWLFVADSEGSSIRAVPLQPRHEVRTIVGTSHLPQNRLFTFGDVDGPAPQVRLQHPLGVVYYQGQLYVADTYNNKIKVIDPAGGTTRTLAGTGKSGHDDEPGTFHEPAGISAAAGKLFVADTNNHLIRVVDLTTRKVSTLKIRGLKPPEPLAERSRPLAGVMHEKLALTAVRPQHGVLLLTVELQLPPGYEINPMAPMAYRVDEATGNGKAASGPIGREDFGKPVRLEKPESTFEIRLPVQSDAGRDAIQVALDYYYCRSGAEGLCKVGSVLWTVPIELSRDASRSTITLRHRVR